MEATPTFPTATRIINPTMASGRHATLTKISWKKRDNFDDDFNDMNKKSTRACPSVYLVGFQRMLINIKCHKITMKISSTRVIKTTRDKSKQVRNKCIYIYIIMHVLPCIPIFGSRVRRFANSFHEWRRHSWAKNCYARQQTYFFSCTQFYVMNTAQKNYRSLISLLSLRTVFSDLALWRRHSWSVTSRERGVLVLWRYIRRLFMLLYAQIGAKAIFTSE